MQRRGKKELNIAAMQKNVGFGAGRNKKTEEGAKKRKRRPRTPMYNM